MPHDPPDVADAPLTDERQVMIAKQTLSRELRCMGFRKLSARPRHHAQKELAGSGRGRVVKMPAVMGRTRV